MSKAKNATVGHTPGPWHVGMRPGPMIYAKDGGWVARCDLSLMSDQAANARLIAAAPDLLAACEAMLDYEDMDYTPSHKDRMFMRDRAITAARAAILAAKGTA